MEYIVEIDEFSGPFDLLLHLIKKSKVDIFDISINEVTQQYIDYINVMEQLNLEVASEYLEMAAELIYMKSKMLLPNKKITEESEYEEDPREALITRLIEYKKYKEVSTDLDEMNDSRQLIFTKLPSNLDQFKPEVTVELEEGIEVYDLIRAFQKMMERKAMQKPLETRLAKREISVSERMDDIMRILDLNEGQKVLFDDIFDLYDRTYIVATFLAILELARKFKIYIEQDNLFDEIYLSKSGGMND